MLLPHLQCGGGVDSWCSKAYRRRFVLQPARGRHPARRGSSQYLDGRPRVSVGNEYEGVPAIHPARLWSEHGIEGNNFSKILKDETAATPKGNWGYWWNPDRNSNQG